MKGKMVALKSFVVGAAKCIAKVVQALINQVKVIRALGWKETFHTRMGQVVWESLMIFLVGNLILGCGFSYLLPGTNFVTWAAKVLLYLYGIFFGGVAVIFAIVKDEVNKEKYDTDTECETAEE